MCETKDGQGQALLIGADDFLLEKEGIDLDVYYVASAELFDVLPPAEQERIFPEERAREAIGVTGFTLATMYHWIRSDLGRRFTMHPFQSGHYPGSGQAEMVLAEAGLDGESQFKKIREYFSRPRPVRALAGPRRPGSGRRGSPGAARPRSP